MKKEISIEELVEAIKVSGQQENIEILNVPGYYNSHYQCGIVVLRAASLPEYGFPIYTNFRNQNRSSLYFKRIVGGEICYDCDGPFSLVCTCCISEKDIQRIARVCRKNGIANVVTRKGGNFPGVKNIDDEFFRAEVSEIHLRKPRR